MLAKWDIVKVWRPDLSQPHNKFCICVDWERRWFLYFNSDPPLFRKARELAVSVENFEVGCLVKTSYIDTTSIVDDLPEKELLEAVNDQTRRAGSVPPFVRERIKEAVESHGVLTDEQRAAILL